MLNKVNVLSNVLLDHLASGQMPKFYPASHFAGIDQAREQSRRNVYDLQIPGLLSFAAVHRWNSDKPTYKAAIDKINGFGHGDLGVAAGSESKGRLQRQMAVAVNSSGFSKIRI